MRCLTRRSGKFIGICDALGLSAFLEPIPKEVLSAVDAGARIIGVNNRDLKNIPGGYTELYQTKAAGPDNIIFIGERHSDPPKTYQCLKIGVDAVLIGETLMRSRDKKGMLQKLRGRRKQITSRRLIKMVRSRYAD